MSAHINDGGPAFPQKEPLMKDCQGMTLRDYFAAQAIAGVCNGGGGLPDKLFCSAAAERAYNLADAMIKVRSTT